MAVWVVLQELLNPYHVQKILRSFKVKLHSMYKKS